MPNGELTKFLIEAYTSPGYDGSPVDSFTAMFNPNGYSMKYEVEYHAAQGRGATGSPQVYGRIKPREFTFEFVLDGTGTAADVINVSDTADHFLTVAGKNDGDIHRPKYLKLSWGALLSKCVLKSADINFNLFKPDGTPLRAKISAVFSENIEDTLRAAQERNSSPDLTYTRMVNGDDKLPLEVYRKYKDQAYYIQVAKINKLKNFRKLKTGDRLIFPPIANAPTK
jgi:hypothetical protein